MSLYVGCPVWSFKGWVGDFYPQGTKPNEFLREYARRLTNIEGNTTFYAVPSPKTVEQWAEHTPESFRFCLKIPKAISHEGKLTPLIPRAHGFVDMLRGLGPRLGPLFLQLPPRYSPNLLADLSTFLSAWSSDVRLAVEVRHPAWFEAPHDEALDALLARHNMARVTIDTRPIRVLANDASVTESRYQSLLEARERKPDLPVVPKRTASFVFVRYIGHPQLEVNRLFLDEWGNYLGAQLKAGAEAFMFCHTPDNFGAPELCREVHHRVAQQVKLAPLPWDELPNAALGQGKLF